MSKSRVAQNLAKLRISKGITQAELACALGISDKVISKWENDASEPSLDMLTALSDFYGVSTDSILRGANDESKESMDTIKELFDGLGYREKIMKAHDISRAMLSAMENLYFDMEAYDGTPICPESLPDFPRSCFNFDHFYNLTVNSDDVNLSVMMCRNKNDFAWLNERDNKNGICKLFALLSAPDTLAVCYFVFSRACSSNFTSDYIARNTGVSDDKVKRILDAFTEYNVCTKGTAHLVSGAVDLYESKGNGNILVLITLAYEHIYGKPSYQFFLNKGCKMIERGQNK